MNEVKAKKMETMKGIKRLQVQKENLAKKQKQAKADYDKVTEQLLFVAGNGMFVPFFVAYYKYRSSGGVDLEDVSVGDFCERIDTAAAACSFWTNHSLGILSGISSTLVSRCEYKRLRAWHFYGVETCNPSAFSTKERQS